MEFRSTLGELAARVRRDRIALAAAGVTYHWFLAVFPFLFAVVAALALTDRSVNDEVISSTIEHVAPAGVDAFLMGLVTQARASADPQGLLTIGIAIALAVVSASSGMAALLQGMEVASESAPQPWFRRRVVALALVVGTLVLAGVAIGFGAAFASLVDILWLVTAIHWSLVVVVIAAVLGAISIARTHGSAAHPFLTPGTAVSIAAIVVASFAIAIFSERFGGSFARTYGTFTSIAVLLLWFYAVAMAVLLGAEIDAVRTPRLRPGRTGIDGDVQGKESAMTSETDTATYRCDLCGETFEREEDLRDHWEAQHAASVVGAASHR